MEEKTLLKKLNDLKAVKPDEAWKRQCQEILRSQISAGATVEPEKSNLAIVWETVMPRQIIIGLAKPVWLSSLASVILLAVVLGGVYASKNTKPGDSLYIAKIISEKAQYAMTFDQKDKAALGLEFAANRAKEINQILKASDQSAAASRETVKKLSQDFKKEISQVKNQLTTLKQASGPAKDDEAEVFGANLGKNDQRLEIAEPIKPAPAATQPAPAARPAADSQNATSTPQAAERADKMLEEAEKLFDEKNYDGTINKLEEANKVISQPSDDGGQVKGESETATSTN